jgi:MFS transporter, MHS family, proline/betaine transporter
LPAFLARTETLLSTENPTFSARMMVAIVSKASGLSIANAVAQTLFGGFTPFISVWPIDVTGSQLAPSFYPMFGATVSIVALVMVRRTGLR